MYLFIHLIKASINLQRMRIFHSTYISSVQNQPNTRLSIVHIKFSSQATGSPSARDNVHNAEISTLPSSPLAPPPRTTTACFNYQRVMGRSQRQRLSASCISHVNTHCERATQAPPFPTNRLTRR